MLKKIATREFAIYTQELLHVEDGDEYNRLKKIKQRATVVKFFNDVLPHKEIIISWSEGDNMFSATATLNTQGFENVGPLLDLPESFDDINGTQIPAQKHISCYVWPTMDRVLLEVDAIQNFIVTTDGLEELLK